MEMTSGTRVTIEDKRLAARIDGSPFDKLTARSRDARLRGVVW